MTIRQHRDIVDRLEDAAKLKDPMSCLLKTKVQKAAAPAEALAQGDETPIFNQKYRGVTSVLNQLVQELNGVLYGN